MVFSPLFVYICIIHHITSQGGNVMIQWKNRKPEKAVSSFCSALICSVFFVIHLTSLEIIPVPPTSRIKIKRYQLETVQNATITKEQTTYHKKDTAKSCSHSTYFLLWPKELFNQMLNHPSSPKIINNLFVYLFVLQL